MGYRANAYLVYGIPLEMDLDEDRFKDGIQEYVYCQRKDDPEYPVDIVPTSTQDHPQYIAIIPGSNNHTDWDEPLMIDELPDPSPVATGALMNWIKTHGLADHIDGDEGWYLAALWG